MLISIAIVNASSSVCIVITGEKLTEDDAEPKPEPWPPKEPLLEKPFELAVGALADAPETPEELEL